MPYADGIQQFIERCNAAMPPDFYKRPLDVQRALYRGLSDVFPHHPPSSVACTDAVAKLADREIPFRIYRPRCQSGDGLLVYIRGGGFVVGSLETHHTVVAELSAKSGLVAVAPDFRMAPEHPFPAAIEDCYAVLEHLSATAPHYGADPENVVICGDSSGANMAVVVCMMARDRKGPSICGQALISPVLDFTRWQTGGGDAPLLTGGEMEYYTACYAPEPGQVGHPFVSPLISGNFAELPPAYIMGAEMDPLLVDAQAYAEHLQCNGTPVELVVEAGLVHSAVRARALCSEVEDAWTRFCKKAAQLASTEERAHAKG